MRFTTLVLVSTLPLTACGGRGGARQEVIDTLRGIGFAAKTLVNTPSTSSTAPSQVAVTFYAAVPTGQTPTFAPFVDTGSTEGALQLPASSIHLDTSTVKAQAYNSFQIYSVTANLDIPTQAQFQKAATPGSGSWIGGQLTYGVSVTAGGVTENSIANLNVFPSGSSQLSWQNPTLSITTPAANASLPVNTQSTISATINDTVSENGIVGWFVSNGDVTNRRAADTSWTPNTAGAETIAVVYHGVNSRGFALQVINVTVTN